MRQSAFLSTIAARGLLVRYGPVPIIIAIIVLVAAVVAGTFLFDSTKAPEVSETPAVERPVSETTATNTEATASAETADASTYTDGTYQSSGTYRSPAGTENVDISITLSDDVITAATFEGHAENPGSVMNQQKFARGYTAAVVGKNIDEVALTVVNGSSLTPIGFMDALAKIKAQAKS